MVCVVEGDAVAAASPAIGMDEEAAAAIADGDEAFANAAREEVAAAAAAEEEEAIAAATIRLAISPPRRSPVLDPTAIALLAVGVEEMLVPKVDAEVCPVVELDAELGCAHSSSGSWSSPSRFWTVSGQIVLARPSRPFHATRHTPPGRT